METETVERLCACVNLPDHEPLCPANTEPSICVMCGSVFDPDDVIRADRCEFDHCTDCQGGCASCAHAVRFGGY